MTKIHGTNDANPNDALSFQVAEVLRSSEIRAVADCMRSGNPVRIGQIVDYVIVPPEGVSSAMSPPRCSARQKPYRVAVEPWHLEEAERMLSKTRGRS